MASQNDDTRVQARRLNVQGRVQGVFYRASTQRVALELGLQGTVRNLPDGSVEVLAQGAPAALDALLAWARRGPPGARVDEVDVRAESVDPTLHDFLVLRP